CLLAVPAAHAQSPLFRGLGDLPEGIFSSRAYGVSADGRVGVGVGRAANFRDEPFRWTEAGGMVSLGWLKQNRGVVEGIFGGAAYAASADGSVVVGKAPLLVGGSYVETAFRWTASGMIGLGVLDGGTSEARGVSGDGTAVVGVSGSWTGREAFRWTEAGGMAPLGFLSEGVPTPESWAFATNQDGSVVVGWSRNGDGNSQAFRWTEAGEMGGLELCDVCTGSVAHGVTPDGSVTVGWISSASGTEAARWTADGEVELLGDLGGGPVSSLAFDVSADGSVVVGEGFSGEGREAFLWTAPDEMRALKAILEDDMGLTLNGWTLRSAHAVSDDGTVIVGEGVNPQGENEAWRVVLAAVWAAPVDGLFSDPARWVAGVAPLPANIVAFDGHGADPFTVTFDGATVSRSLIVSDSEVTFDLAGHAYTFTGLPLRVGPGEAPPAALRAEDGTLTAASGLVIGEGPGSEGTLDASASAVQVAEGAFSAVGDAGVGRLTGRDASTLLFTGPLYVGRRSSGNGTLTLGDGSQAATQDTVWVGYRGVGGLEVTTGAALTAANVVLGRHPGSFGTALVT
ncbi:MAG: hypothetical protein R3362_12490, partial [Rhodothermales bacterium]|nr:hypothetical protein [Rhodothermales bacterium]